MTHNTAKTLIFNITPDGDVKWAREKLEALLPNTSITVLDVHHNQSVWSQWKLFLEVKGGVYENLILPYQNIYTTFPWYWIQVIMFLIGNNGNCSFISPKGLISPRKAVETLFLALRQKLPFLYLLQQPFYSILILFRLPVYMVQQVLLKFILTRESYDDEFVGFGTGKGVGGLVYWLTWTRKARHYGLFGIASDTYMGMPLSVHSWPFAVGFLKTLGFRGYVYLSAVLLSLGLGSLSIASGNPWTIALIPLILCSSYFVFNIYISTWEVLAWGFGFVAFAASYMHMPVLAGIFLGASIITHPGAGFLISILLAAFVTLSRYTFLELVWMSATAMAFTIWWIIPYLRSRSKLGRDFMINQIWQYPYKWDEESIYQFVVYSAFFVIVMLERSSGWSFILLLPLMLLYYNIKIHWSFSKYTVYNYMLMAGAIHLAIHPAFYSLLSFLLLIYTSGEIIWPGTGSTWGFDLTPVVLGETRNKVKDMFTSLQPDRIALEITKSRSHIGWGLIGPLGYILSDQKIEILNPGYSEIGDSQIFEKYCRYFNAESTAQEFKTACQEAGVKYVVAFTDDFCKHLDLQGCRPIKKLSNVYLSEAPNGILANLTLYELPWLSSLISPETRLQTSPNEMKFDAVAGQTYIIRYSSFKGWRAFQQGRPVLIKDAHPGMALTAVHDGPVLLKYKYQYYWS